MRDKERLELLENGSSFSSDDITFLLRQARLYQISRDGTRKACHKVRKENKKLEQQNKRYRESLEEILSIEEDDDFNTLSYMALEIMGIAREALESDEG